MKIATIVMAVLFLVSGFSASAMGPEDVINCANNYTGALRVATENSSYHVTFEARGFFDVHPLAGLLGLPAVPKLGRGEFRIPAADCRVETGRAQMTCRSLNVIAVFIGEDNSIVTKLMEGITFKTGVLGAGPDSSQMIFMNVVFGGQQIFHEESYQANFNTHSGHHLCGKRVE